ncbi:hypothetical protein SP21_64 [Salmonella phage 21]|nr:hypothetical protein SP21_64 [Salmonella phage 21]
MIPVRGQETLVAEFHDKLAGNPSDEVIAPDEGDRKKAQTGFCIRLRLQSG